MASPRSPQSEYQAGSDEVLVDQYPRTQDIEYQENHLTEVVITKTGDEESSLFERGRPVSAGTANGTDVDFDHFSDNMEGVIAECAFNATTTAVQDRAPDEITDKSPFFTRPDMHDNSHAIEGFQFGKASHKQVHINAGRPTSAKIIIPAPEPGGEDAPSYDTPPATKTEGDSAALAGHQVGSHGLVDNEPTFALETPTPQPESGERQRASKKPKSRPQPQLIVEAPIEVSSTFAIASSPEVQHPEAGITEDYPQDSGRNVHPDIMEVQHNHATQDHRSTPNDYTQRESSPHDQLQNDLDAATQEPSYHAEESSATLAHGSQDFGGEHRAPSPVADHEIAATHASMPARDEHQDHSQHTMHAPSPVAPSRTQKRKHKPRRTAPEPQPQPAGPSNWELRDYADLIVLKANEREQAYQAAFTSDLEALRTELCQSNESRAALQEDLDSVLSQKQSLTATASQQQKRIDKYESKFKTLKTYVDGVGKDLDALRKDALNLRRRGDDILVEVENTERQLVTYSAARDEVNGQIEKCSNIRKEAVKLTREKEEELIRTTLHRDQLQHSLSDTVGMLSEQRDRCAKLETQLQESGKLLSQSLKTNHDAMLDKLHLIHAAIEDEESKNDTSKMIEQLRSASEAIGSPTDSTLQGLAKVKDLVESLDQRLNSNMEVAQATESSSREHLEEALKAIQAQLADREQLEENHCGVVNSLQEQLKTCNERIGTEEAQKSAAQEQLHESQEKNLALQSKILALQSKISPAENAQVQLGEAKLEIEKTVRSLASAKVELENKTEELKTLTLANNELADQLKAVQERLQSLQSVREEPIPAQTIEKRIKEAEDRARKEMTAHIENFEAQLKTESNNGMKKLNSEKIRLEKQIKPLQDELATCRRQIDAMKTEKPAAVEALKQELERTKKRSQSQQRELETLQSTITDLKRPSLDSKGLQDKLSTLSAQLNAEQSNAQQTSERNSELQEQLKQLEDAREETELAKEQALEELATLRLNGENRLTALQKDLDDAKENADRATAGLEAYKKSCDDAINTTQKQNERKLQDLQKQLSETQAELQNAREENKAFYEGVEQTWKDEQDAWSNKVAEATKKIADIEAQNADAQTSYKAIVQQLRTELDEQRRSMKAENDKLQAQQSKADSRIQVQSLKDGIPPSQRSAAKPLPGSTPSASDQSIAPPVVPRKKINRNADDTTHVGPIPAPEEIRPDSRKTNSAHESTTNKGPVVEESQFGLDQFAMHHAQPPTLQNTQSSFSSLIDEHNGTINDKQTQPEQLTIPETQLDDDGDNILPTFAAINDSLRTMPSGSSSFENPSDIARLTETGKQTQHVLGFVKARDRGEWHADQSQSQVTYVSGGLSQMQPWSQEEQKKYTYQPPVPQPNSGSKRIEPTANSIKRRGSGPDPKKDRFKTPTLDARISDIGKQAPPSSSGSSPAFLNGLKDTSTSRRLNTYGTPGRSGGKQRSSQAQEGHIQDPRLIGRNDRASVKRKATGQVVEGYEQERKKRMATKDKDMGITNRLGRTQHAQSINDLPNERSTRRRSQNHMQTFAGESPRITRASRKGSGQDAMNALFAAKLANPR